MASLFSYRSLRFLLLWFVGWWFLVASSVETAAAAWGTGGDGAGGLIGRMHRKLFVQRLREGAVATAAIQRIFQPPGAARAADMNDDDERQRRQTSSLRQGGSIIDNNKKIAYYKALSLSVDEFGVNVPVACWFPTAPEDSTEAKAAAAPTYITRPSSTSSVVTYDHTISVKRIGELLAGWDSIPPFFSRSFTLRPTLSNVRDGQNVPLPSPSSSNGDVPSPPVVLLAHGYLGSRFDLSHLAESLAQEGFICLAAEYPESLAASYERVEGLDRAIITDKLLDMMKKEWNLSPATTNFGIVGHSLGCGTAIQTGDDKTWTRVCLAGFPVQRDGSRIPGDKVLFVSSMNDGAVSLSRVGGKEAISPDDYTMLSSLDDYDASSKPPSTTTATTQPQPLPSRAALIMEGPGAPNHISFLSEGVNDAMISLLSPLLPLAQVLEIPVLDFDKYQTSRDSAQTAQKLHPLVVRYLKEHMIMTQQRQQQRSSSTTSTSRRITTTTAAASGTE